MIESFNFSKDSYAAIVEHAKSRGYKIIPFSGIRKTKERSILYRHDVDICLEKAVELAELEHSLGVQSTYFVLLATEHYNLASIPSRRLVKDLIKLGHDVGLHWDSRTYPQDHENAVLQFKTELKFLETIIGQQVLYASQHYPADTPPLDISAYVELESYSPEIQQRFKYTSDSSMSWREFTPIELIDQNIEIHFLSHPIWWVTEGRTQREIYEAQKEFACQKISATLNEERDYVLAFLANRAVHDAEFKKKRGW